ncbi:MAG: S-adenosylmethionine decarboxylase [Patescibacteria group bacterium]|jgi:S-adenosylmethionine decarboxylase
MQVKRFHNIFDMENCGKKIGDRAIVREFIEKLAEEIDMNILEGPIIAEGLPHSPGFSVLAIIDFSHISIHTFTRQKEALIDVFSCKEYDKEKVHGLCKKYFGTKNTKIRAREVWWG